MESLFRDLAGILEAERDNLKQLSDTAREHHRALRQLDMDALAAAVRKEEEVARRISVQDRKRKEIVGDLAVKLGLPGDAPLSRFVGEAPPPLKGDLSRLMSDMIRLAGEVGEINVINRSLTRQAMRINDILHRALSTAKSGMYTPDGHIRKDQSLSVVDKKV